MGQAREENMSQGIPREFWNERFSEDGFAYGTQPSRLLLAWSPDLSQDRYWNALVPACGEGRDAVYLAELGHNVTALDISAEGLKKTQKLAKKRNVELTTVEADLFEWDWPVETFDVIASTYAHMPSEARKRLHALYVQALKPGGMICLEGFSKEQLAYQEKYQSGGPPNIDMLYSVEDIRADFDGLEELSMTTGVEVLEEGKYHTGPAALLRAVYRKMGNE